MTPAGIALGTRALASLPSWTVVDAFAQAWGTRGPLPPPVGPVQVLVDQHVVADERHPIEPPLELEVRRSLSDVFVLTMRTVPASSGPRLRLPAGRYRARLVSEFYRERVFDADLTPGTHSGPILLAPAPAYPFPASAFGSAPAGPTVLRGGLCSADGTGIAGAAVEVIEPSTWTLPRAVTDAAGEWMVLAIGGDVGIDAPKSDEAPPGVHLRITLPDAEPIELTDVAIVRGRDNTLVQTSLRGSVGDASGRSLPGVTVGVIGRPETTRSDANGAWRLYFAPNESPGRVRLQFRLPDGRTVQVAHHVIDGATTIVPMVRFP